MVNSFHLLQSSKAHILWKLSIEFVIMKNVIIDRKWKHLSNNTLNLLIKAFKVLLCRKLKVMTFYMTFRVFFIHSALFCKIKTLYKLFCRFSYSYHPTACINTLIIYYNCWCVLTVKDVVWNMLNCK